MAAPSDKPEFFKHWPELESLEEVQTLFKKYPYLAKKQLSEEQSLMLHSYCLYLHAFNIFIYDIEARIADPILREKFSSDTLEDFKAQLKNRLEFTINNFEDMVKFDAPNSKVIIEYFESLTDELYAERDTYENRMS